jgi:hypothetical protein
MLSDHASVFRNRPSAVVLLVAGGMTQFRANFYVFCGFLTRSGTGRGRGVIMSVTWRVKGRAAGAGFQVLTISEPFSRYKCWVEVLLC